MNKYYIIPIPNSSLRTILAFCVGKADTLRYSIDGTKAIVQTRAEEPAVLNGITSYTLAEILPIVRGALWEKDRFPK